MIKNHGKEEVKEQIKTAVAHEAWRRGILEYKLDSLQLQILNDVQSNNRNKILILSSRQIGKSYWSCIYALKYLLTHPNTIGRIVAPTLDQAYDIVDDNLNKILEDAPESLIYRKKSSLRWDFSNGSSLRLGGLKRAHVDSNRGGNASLVIYEECGFTNGDDFTYGINSVLGPQLLRSAGKEVYVSTPSDNPDHPLHINVLPECETSGSLYRYTVFDSPSISPHMIEEAIKRSGGRNTDAFRREYMAEIIRSDSFMIVPFNLESHVKNFDKPKKTKWGMTIDWGGVRDKTVSLLHTYDFVNNKLLIWDEKVWESNTPTDHIVQGINDLRNSHGVTIDMIYADVPGQISIDLLNNYNMPVSAPAKNNWLASVNNMASEFNSNNIIIHPQCKFLIRTCYSGMFNKNRTDFLRTDDLGHCDALAALMYAIRAQDREIPKGKEHISYTDPGVFNFPVPEEDNSIIKFNSSFIKRKNSFMR